MKCKVNINKIAHSLGFTILYQTFDREYILGYINKGDIDVIVVPIMDQIYQRYVIADCLVHYLEAKNSDAFYYEVDAYTYDDRFTKLIADLLIPTRAVRKLSKRKNNQELSEYFNVPLFLIERKLLELNSKQKKYSK